MTDFKNLLSKLKITQPGVWEGDSYTIEVDSSDAWGKLESKLDAGVDSGLLELDDDRCIVEEDGAFSVYTFAEQATNTTVQFSLTADFDADLYTLTLEVI